MRTFFYRAGKWIWRFMVIFSFIVNIILVLVLLALGVLIFDIKNNIAGPLVTGLHSSFVGLDEATIDWTIPVREPALPVNLSVPINADTITSQVTTVAGVPVSPIAGETVVRLTRDVPITLRGANITSSSLTLTGATVNISLPAGTELPVSLNLEVAVNSSIPVNLDVRAVIPLEGTQLHDVANNLRLLFEPLARGLVNLPNDFGGAAQMVGDILAGKPINLLSEDDPAGYVRNPWQGFSQTAGLNYDMPNNVESWPLAHQPLDTGIVVTGGIPALDEQLRPEIYEAGGPQAVNAQAQSNMLERGVQAETYGAPPLDSATTSGEPSIDTTAESVPLDGTVEAVPGQEATEPPPMEIAPTFTPLATSDFSVGATPQPGG